MLCKPDNFVDSNEIDAKHTEGRSTRNEEQKGEHSHSFSVLGVGVLTNVPRQRGQEGVCYLQLLVGPSRYKEIVVLMGATPVSTTQRTLLATNTSSRRCFCLVEGCSVEMCVSFCVDEPAVMGKYVSVRTRNRIVALRSLLMKFLILSIFCRFEPFTRNLVTHFGSVQNLNPEPFQSNGICHHSHHRSTTHQ